MLPGPYEGLEVKKALLQVHSELVATLSYCKFSILTFEQL